MSDYTQWLGGERLTTAWLDSWPAQALSASIESTAPIAAELPLLWHWLYFLETPLRADQGHDGHPKKGDFYPPIEQPRRMFVGCRSEKMSPLRFGADAELRETILRCEDKRGSSGAMTLLTVGYDYYQGRRHCIREERDFMYLPARAGETPEERCDAPVSIPAASWQSEIETDPVLLFKFSALTFNGHRIHYDREYARQAESYPDLVVHGPMTAILLAELVRARAETELAAFNFRARAPLFAGDIVRMRGEPAGRDGSINLEAYRPDGAQAMTAEARIL